MSLEKKTLGHGRDLDIFVELYRVVWNTLESFVAVGLNRSPLPIEEVESYKYPLRACFEGHGRRVCKKNFFLNRELFFKFSLLQIPYFVYWVIKTT